MKKAVAKKTVKTVKTTNLKNIWSDYDIYLEILGQSVDQIIEETKAVKALIKKEKPETILELFAGPFSRYYNLLFNGREFKNYLINDCVDYKFEQKLLKIISHVEHLSMVDYNVLFDLVWAPNGGFNLLTKEEELMFALQNIRKEVLQPAGKLVLGPAFSSELDEKDLVTTVRSINNHNLKQRFPKGKISYKLGVQENGPVKNVYFDISFFDAASKMVAKYKTKNPLVYRKWTTEELEEKLEKAGYEWKKVGSLLVAQAGK